MFIDKEEFSIDNLSQALASNGFIQVNKMLIKNLGLHEAVLIGELCSEYNFWKSQNKLDDGAFFSTRENIEDNTGLTEHHQRNAIETLIEKNILTIEKKGMPAVNYYKINFESLFLQLSEALTTSASTCRQQVVRGADINNNKQTIISSKNNKPSTNVEGTAENGRNNSTIKNSLIPGIIIDKPKKNKKANLYEKCDTYIIQFTNNIILQEKLREYLNARLDMAKEDNKPFYYNMWPPIVNDLNNLSEGNVDIMLKIIDESIRKGWKKFYPLKDYSKKSVKANSSERNVVTDKKIVDVELVEQSY